MDSKFTVYLPTQLGHLIIELEGNKICSLCLHEKVTAKLRSVSSNMSSNNRVVKSILLQLNNYFTSATAFKSMPLSPSGTPFQISVWNELNKIPLGEIRTYGEIAKKLNSSPRAVGNACRRNPIQIIIPCHRVVSAKGLGGYAGETDGKQINIKRWLLNHEGVHL